MPRRFDKSAELAAELLGELEVVELDTDIKEVVVNAVVVPSGDVAKAEWVSGSSPHPISIYLWTARAAVGGKAWLGVTKLGKTTGSDSWVQYGNTVVVPHATYVITNS